MRERKELLQELKALRETLRQKYGYLDITGWVEEARAGLH